MLPKRWRFSKPTLSAFMANVPKHYTLITLYFDEVTSAEREVLDPRDLLALKEKKDKKDMGCQVSVTTAGDERTALAMQL